MNGFQNELSNANYLMYKFEQLNSYINKDLNIDKNFLNNNTNYKNNNSDESSFNSYSKIRNDMIKLQLNKNGNSYLPLSVISTFLHKLPNINFNDYINESDKPVNFYLNKSLNSNLNNYNIRKNFILKKNIRSFKRLNSINYFKKLPVIDQFAIYHKNLKRPGNELKNRYNKLPTNPFRRFKTFENLYSRSIDYGMSDYIFKNSPVNRRIYDLALRKFGPDLRTNSVMRGYGSLDDITDFNLNTEEDSGLNNNLGYPILNEQNIYVYDFPDLLPYFGGNIYSDKFLGFIWDYEYDKDINENSNNKKTGEGLYSSIPIFGYMSDNSDISEDEYENELKQGSLLDLFNDLKIVLETEDEEGLNYNFNPSFSRYVQVWNNTLKRKYKDREDYEEQYEDPQYNDLFSRDLNQEHIENPWKHSYMQSIRSDSPYDIISSFELSTGKIWDKYQSKNLNGPLFEYEVTVPLAKDFDEKNIGPLGYEEGDSLYDNRMLNRGWFPEKLIWNWGVRSNSKVGSDMHTLEVLSDYSSSFAHNLENYGYNADLEGLKSLGWAGKNNKVFNTIDDIIEGLGIEENIPFKPDIARSLWEWDEYLERPSYEMFDLEPFAFNEDDEQEFYWNWEEPSEYYQFKDNNFNTLGLNNYISETNSWKNSNYLAGLESAYIPGISLALADNELNDGIVSDFSNFLYEKFPNKIPNLINQKFFPKLTKNLFSNADYIDSTEPKFADYITTYPLRDRFHRKNYNELGKKELDSHFYIHETFKPKDEFSFSPNSRSFLKFDSEWVVNGEGWLGNSGSNIPIISKNNIPLHYLDPIASILTQPKGLHSFKIQNDYDNFLGEDSPYFSLSDYQNNRIIRGRDNDISNFPINSGWNMISRVIPSSLNIFWSHRSLSKSFNIFDENNYNLYFNDLDYSSWLEKSSILSGEGYNFSNTLNDNPDFLVFNSSALNQRDLWWKSIKGGYLTPSAKLELNSHLIIDNSENYRDFLTSYDYRIFGKSWMNPQEIQMPLKSFNFYGDSQINTFLNSTDDFYQNYYENQNNAAKRLISDYTFGFFKSSQMNFDLNLNFYSIRIRIFLFKIYTFINFYLTSNFTFITWSIMLNFYNFINFFIFKLNIIEILIQNINIFQINYCFQTYLINLILLIFKFINCFFYIIINMFNKIQLLNTISSFNISNNYFITIIDDLHKIFSKTLYFKFYNIIKILIINFICYIILFLLIIIV